jgi:hypothetical protein
LHRRARNFSGLYFSNPPRPEALLVRGHRQPRASDVPNNEKNLSSDPISKEDAILDKKMKSICRGC